MGYPVARPSDKGIKYFFLTSQIFRSIIPNWAWRVLYKSQLHHKDKFFSSVNLLKICKCLENVIIEQLGEGQQGSKISLKIGRGNEIPSLELIL